MAAVWGLANPALGERNDAKALLTQDQHLVTASQVIVGDKGFAGRNSNASSSAASVLGKRNPGRRL
ncbi:hypothetical protein [Arthrobacter cavernae]|uniref:Transposase IS4-like domain-containing protein n=1 Tax=Arthrobacter cavernae TaxID=2817681 RepID=A0A939KLY4_9MICC|nr:hypothetical protein [Arthrobacter cavernae]MBO1267748.1 hypothetical protein [Arthrobacter cavernae]